MPFTNGLPATAGTALIGSSFEQVSGQSLSDLCGTTAKHPTLAFGSRSLFAGITPPAAQTRRPQHQTARTYSAAPPPCKAAATTFRNLPAIWA